MIVDLLENTDLYAGVGGRLAGRIEKAFEYLRNTDLEALELGDHPIEGKTIFARALSYSTRLDGAGVWEAHRHCLDLQVIVEGAERIRYAPLSRLAPGEYNELKDFWRLSGEGGDDIVVPAGSFMLLWPTDGHMPCLCVGAPAPVKKVVVKISTD